MTAFAPHGSFSRVAKMPEFHSGIVAVLLEYPWKIPNPCKHDCEFSLLSSSLLAQKNRLGTQLI